jgi:DNA ligase D-like protein (predicted 3'-phosphoesterase)
MAERTGTRAFVLHRHDATTLHHDLRLEVDDVMFSFAAPKGPTTDPSVQRLVVRTADHELDVADFQGLFPENEYGSGQIMIWDRGTDRKLRARKDHLGMPASLDDGLLEVFLEGERLFRDAGERGWEGLIATGADAPYRHTRSRDWRKFACGHRQESVVVGWNDPGGSRVGFGALLLGTYDGDALRYHCRVGTGFDDDELRSLHERLADLETDASAPADPPDEDDVHWAGPELVAEVGKREWTVGDRLRPRATWACDDKPAHDVVREWPS